MSYRVDDDWDVKDRLRRQFLIIEDFRDFLEWLFEDLGIEGVDWMTQNEAWRRFRIYQWCQDKKQNREPQT